MSTEHKHFLEVFAIAVLAGFVIDWLMPSSATSPIPVVGTYLAQIDTAGYTAGS